MIKLHKKNNQNRRQACAKNDKTCRIKQISQHNVDPDDKNNNSVQSAVSILVYTSRD